MVEIFTLKVAVKISKLGGILIIISQFQCTIYNANSVLAIILVDEQLSLNMLKNFRDFAL